MLTLTLVLIARGILQFYFIECQLVASYVGCEQVPTPQMHETTKREMHLIMIDGLVALSSQIERICT